MFKITNLFPVVAIVFGLTTTTIAQQSDLKAQLQEIIRGKDATVGVAVKGPGMAQAITLNSSHHFPMQSVYKLPLAIAVLKAVDAGKLKLSQQILVTKKDLLPTHSPIRDKYPEGGVYLTIEELLIYTVSLSDNNGCDILFRLMGGTAKIDAAVKQMHIKEMAIKATEEEMSKGWNVQYTNYSTPGAMLNLLEQLHAGKLLSPASTGFLKKVLMESPTGPEKLRAKLPKGTVVAHKTGASTTNTSGLTAASNDAGWVNLPDGGHFSIVVFVSNSKEPSAVNAAIIADLARCVWDYYHQPVHHTVN